LEGETNSDKRKAQCRGGNIARRGLEKQQLRTSSGSPYPHTRKARDPHKCKQDRARARASHAKYLGDEDAIYSSFAQGSRNRESSDQQHDGWGEHDRKDKPCCGEGDVEVRGSVDTYLVASGGVKRVTTPSSPVLRITRKQTKSNGMSIDVTNRGIACPTRSGAFRVGMRLIHLCCP